MKKKFAIFFTVIGIVIPSVLFSQQTVSIDVKANQKSISPLIYGANNATANATAIRWGGNRTTGYNWENNYSNGGNDYSNISDNFFTSGTTTGLKPAYPIINMVQNANNRKQYTLVTLQAAGFVAADANGIVTETQEAPSNRWDTVIFKKGSAFTLNPDLTDGKVYIDELINYLEQTLGTIGNGGIDAFAIDNEPALWNSTHPRIRPTMVTPNELFYKTRELGTLIKDFNPQTEVYGPMFYGWWDAKNFNNSGYPSNKNYNWFVDYYLDTLKNIENELGKRIVDVLAVHWYPEAKGSVTKKRIVNLDGSATTEELIAPDMIEARLQAPRSLWDQSYYENSSIANAYLIKRLQNSINTFYPGTKLALTEFKYDAEFHFSGGLALADVLGIFGREGVYMASKWDPIADNYGGAAYKLYLNYDNQGSQFGNKSISCTTNNDAILSTFASTYEEKNVHIIVINKSNTAKTTDFSIANGFYSHGEVFGFDQNDKTIRPFTNVPSVTNSSFNYSIPAYSAMHFIIYAKPQTQITKAIVLEPNSSNVIITFDSNISILNTTDFLQDFIVKNNDGNPLVISSHSIINDTLLLILQSPFTGNDSLCNITYSGTSIVDQNNIPINEIDRYIISNELNVAPLYVRNSEINTTGKLITITFSKKLNSNAEINSGLSIIKENLSVSIDSIKIDESGYKLYFYPTQRILKYDQVFIENTNNTLISVDGTLASNFNVLITNYGPNYSPTIDSIKTIDNFTLQAFINMNIENSIDTSDFQLYNNGTPIESTITYNNKIFTFITTYPLYKENSYTLSYKDNNNIISFFGGYLNSFTNVPITNLLKSTPSYSTIPNLIEAENYTYHKSYSVLETCSDIGNGLHIGFINTKNIFGYKIKADISEIYTLTLRHSGASQNGLISIYIDGVKQSNLFIPKTGSWNIWKNSSIAFNIAQGEHMVEIRVINTGFNLNWISFEQGNNPSICVLQSAQTNNTGNKIYLVYDRLFKTIPLSSQIYLVNNNIPLNISNIEFTNNDSSKITITLENNIYKNDVVLMSYSNISTTTENGIIESINNFNIVNKSTIIKVSISDIENSNISIYPNPAKINEPFKISTNSEHVKQYKLYNILGEHFYEGNFTKSKELILNKSGVYILEIFENNKSYFQKIYIK